MKKNLLLLSLLILISCILTACNQNTLNRKIIKLNHQQIIENYTKIDVVPYPISPKNNIKFDITMESYQNEEMLKIDLSETALLEDQNGELYKPIKWMIIKEDKYQTKGLLIFPPIKKISVLKLKLVQIDDESFKWTTSIQ